ncbi:hypothetical protein D3C81_1360040 [compost metagenome]
MLFTTPLSTENSENASAYTRIQLIKFGIVVSVCTNLRYQPALTSVSRIAKITGKTEVTSPSELIATVFFSTRSTSPVCVGFSTIVRNHFSPTKGVSDSGIPGMKS